MKFFRRIRYLLNRRRAERDLQAEMSAHREMLAAERQRSFGSDLRLREQSRDAWGWNWIDQLRQDLAYGARQLRRSPGFTLTAIMVLALGVGLNLGVFQMVKDALYSRVPVNDSASLLRVVRKSPERERFAFPHEAARLYRENADQFSYLVSERTGTIPLPVDNQTAPARSQFISGNYCSALGLTPSAGRLLGPRDEAPEAAPVAVLSFAYWQRQFGADPQVVGRSLSVNEKPVMVVGVMPQEFEGLSPSRADLWFPSSALAYLTGEPLPADPSRRPYTAVIGTLKPGVSIEAADAQLRALTAGYRQQQPTALEGNELIRARPLDKDDRNTTVVFLVPLVLLVLFSACANLGNMLLARGLTREREIATRIALGAGRWRVIRQLMTESLLLAAFGAIAGVFVGRVGAHLLAVLFDGLAQPRIQTDWSMIAAAGALALFSMLLFGLAPALHAVRRGARATRTRRTLLGVQVAASCVLLICSGLLSRGAQRLTAAGRRLDMSTVLIVEPNLDASNVTGAAARRTLEGIRDRLALLPGVEGVTIAGGAPVRGVSVIESSGLLTTLWQSVDPSYFVVLKVPLTRGRNFLPGETNVAIVSESAARVRWPDRSPLGESWGLAGEGPVVVGVAADSEATAFRDPGAIEAYAPIPDRNIASAVLVVRAHGDPGRIVPDARKAATVPGLIPTVWLLQTYLDGWIEHSKKATNLLGGLGSVASFLAGVGIFGLIAFAVTERTREIGVRIALGAGRRAIIRTLFAQYTGPLVAGTIVGIVLAYLLAQAMRAQIILGLVNFDPIGYLLGLGAFLIVVVAAILIPLRRALRIDPASALRWE
jgi:putative ABC transport system permease protein